MGSILLNPSQLFFSQTILDPLKKQKLHHHGSASASRNRLECKNINRTSSFNYRSTASVPLHELPSASFDEYIEDKGRVIRSIFPEKSTSHQLNQEEWRVKMSPMEALFIKCHPVIHITAKCKSEAHEYPPQIPHHITKVLEVQITKVEFPDLNADYVPTHLNINAKGALYLEKKGMHNLMKNQLDINLNLVFPPLLAWVPELVLQNILQSVLKNYVDDINNGFAVRLLGDYNSFKRNKSKHLE